MKIKIANTCGFCFGVKRAIEKIEDIKDKESLHILGQLIHNPQTINRLKEQGVKFINSLNEIESGTVVISALGVSDKIIDSAKGKGLIVIDTTCPLVSKVHETTKRLESEGKKIIILGDKNHTEVRGTIGNLKCPIIISHIDELSNLPNDNYALVSQTTQETKDFNEIAESLVGRFPNITIEDTICDATKNRQRDAKNLAKESDIMIVIGGYNSANTRKLKTVCEKITRTKHIEYPKELKSTWFTGCDNIGITAGASTPQSTIDSVIEKIKEITK